MYMRITSFHSPVDCIHVCDGKSCGGDVQSSKAREGRRVNQATKLTNAAKRIQ